MSTEKGNGSRTRAQKYKNRHVFKNDLHDKTPKQKMINTLHISEVCQHCKGVIEWKIKYKKYKPLTQAKTCTKCQQRNIRKAYHVLCRSCALEAKVCAKCLKSATEVEIEPAQPTPAEQIKLKVEMERLIKSFPERKRRAFLRYMDKGKKEAIEDNEEDTAGRVEDDDLEDVDTKKVDMEVKRNQRIPHSREDLLKKIEQMKLEADDDYFGFGSDDDDGDDEEDETGDDNSDKSSLTD